MKKTLIAVALSCAIALAGTALWAQNQAQQTPCDKCPTAAQKTTVAAATTCICPDCANAKQDPACGCGCKTRECDLKGCGSCAKKEKSQQKPCCDRDKAQK